MNKIRQFLTILLFGCALSVFGAVVPSSSQKLELKQGWNMVTLTRPLVDDSAEDFLSLQPMTLDIDTKCYVRCTSKDDLKVGVGYWIFSPTDQPPKDLVHDQTQTSYETAVPIGGWNLIGVADSSTWIDQATAIWQWLDGKFQTITKEELKAGNAYWIE